MNCWRRARAKFLLRWMAELQGARVLVTRAEHQAQGLIEAIRRAGGVAIAFPVLEIREVQSDELLSAASNIGQYDWAIFVSPNAVQMAMRRLDVRSFSPGIRIAAVGKATAAALEKAGVEKVFHPLERYDSEALLEIPELRNVCGAKIVIFRGDGGREHLGEALQARGAEVEQLTCYQRLKPEVDATALRALWENGQLDAASAMSGETVQNLLAMAGEWIREVPLFVVHPRIKSIAEQLGFAEVVLTAGGDEGLLAGMVEWFANKRKRHGNG